MATSGALDGLQRDGAPVGVEPHQPRRAPACCAAGRDRPGSRSSSACCVTSTGAAGVRQHERQPLRRIRRVERQIGAARLEDAEQPDHHLQRALDAKPHHASRAPPRARAGDAPAGWRAHPAPRSSARDPHTPPRPHPAWRAPAPRTAPAGWPAGTARAVAFHSSQDARALRRRTEPPAAPIASIRRRNRRLQKPHQTSRQRLHARRDQTGRADSRAAACSRSPGMTTRARG